MTPEQIKLAIQGAVLAGLLAIGFAAGWFINGWRLHADVADLKTARAVEIAVQYKDAAEDLKASAEVVKEAAIGNRTDVTAISSKLAAIDQRIKNAPPAPLPPDCKPGPVRLRDLSEAAAAVDKTIARPVAGR